MKRYVIAINDRLDAELTARAAEAGVAPEDYLSNLAKLFLEKPHSIDREGMKKGYEEMGALNLALADIGDSNGKRHKKGFDFFRRPKPGGRE